MADKTFDISSVPDPFVSEKKGFFGTEAAGGGVVDPSNGIPDPFSPSEPTTILGEIPKGLKAGFQQLRGMGYGVGALVGEATGVEPVKTWAKEGLEDVEAKTPKPLVGSYADIGKEGEPISDVAKYLAYGITTNLPNMLLSFAGGGAGALVAKGLVGKAATEAIKAAAIKSGALVGAGASSIGMEAGMISSDQLTENGKVDPLRAMAGAIPAGLLDIIPEWYLAKRLGWLGKEVSKMDGGRAVRALKVAGQQFAMEAPTEAMQSVLERAAVEGKSITNAEAWDEYINSFILGGLTGGVVGGVGGMFTRQRETSVQQATNTDPITKGSQELVESDEDLKKMQAAIDTPVVLAAPKAEDNLSPADAAPVATPAPAPVETPAAVLEPTPAAQPAAQSIVDTGQPSPEALAAVAEGERQGMSKFLSTRTDEELQRLAEIHKVKGAAELLAARKAGQVAAPTKEQTPPEVLKIYAQLDMADLVDRANGGSIYAQEEIERRNTEVRVKSHEAATSPLNNLSEPSIPQKEAGNFKMGHPVVQGLPISIENPAGSVREGVDENGNKWQTTMVHDYGYIRRTEGVDTNEATGKKDKIDVFVGPNPESQKAFIVDQKDPATGKFDEHKTLVGFNTIEEARAGYLANYDQTGESRIMGITEMSMDQFKGWLKGDTTKRVSSETTNTPTAVNPPGPAAVLPENAPNAVAGTEVAQPGASSQAENPVRYDPSVDRYNGEKMTRGDILTDKDGNRYRLDRASGFMLTADKLNEAGNPAGIESFSVDPTDKTRFKDVLRTGENAYSAVSGQVAKSAAQPAQAVAPTDKVGQAMKILEDRMNALKGGTQNVTGQPGQPVTGQPAPGGQRPAAGTEDRGTGRDNLVPSLREGRERKLDIARRGALASPYTSPKLKDAIAESVISGQPGGLILDEEAYNNPVFKELYPLADTYGLDILLVIEPTNTFNGFMLRGTDIIVLNTSPASNLTFANTVLHEISHHKGNEETQRKINVMSAAFNRYAMVISEAVSVPVTEKWVLQEYAADMESGLKTRFGVELSTGLYTGETVETIRPNTQAAQRGISQAGEEAAQFSIRKKDKRSLGARILAGTERPPRGVGKLVRQVAAYLSGESAKEGSIDFRTATPQENRQVERALVDMLEASITKHPEALGWYKGDIELTMAILQDIYPDLKNKADSFRMKLALAITSDGNNNINNVNFGRKSYEAWKKKGNFVTAVAAKRGDAITSNLQFAERMAKTFASEAEFESWLLSKATGTEIATELSERLNIPLDAAKAILSGNNLDAVVHKSTIFGPKLGAFFANLSGDFSPVTMDMWFMRTIGRITGNLMEGGTDLEVASQRFKLRDAIRKSPEGLKMVGGQATLQFSKEEGGYDIDDMAKHIQKLSGDKGFRDRLKAVPGGDKLRLAANNRAMHIAGALPIDAPRSGAQRQWLRDRMDAVREAVNKKGIPYENADIQAAIWIGEKEIYHAFGAKATKGDYFSYGANALYERVRGRPSERFTAAARRMDKNRASVAEQVALFSPRETGITSKIFQTIKDNPSGFTIDISNGETVKKGYAVAPTKRTATVQTELTEENILAFIRRFRPVFDSDKRAFLGGWLDNDAKSADFGKYVLDVSFVVDKFEDAVYIADLGIQDGIYHIDGANEDERYIRTEDAVKTLKERGVFNESRRSELGGIREGLHRLIPESGIAQGEAQAGEPGTVGGPESLSTGHLREGLSLSVRFSKQEALKKKIILTKDPAAGALPEFKNKTVTLTHWSKIPDLTKTDPNKHGTGYAGAESRAKASFPELWLQKTYAGLKGYKAEVGLGKYRYQIDAPGNSLYDAWNDPMGLHPSADEIRKAGYYVQAAGMLMYEQRMKQLGFKGFIASQYNVAALFEPMKAVKVAESGKTLKQGGEVQFQTRPVGSIVSNAEVYQSVQDIHRNYEDFTEGDLAERLDKYNSYKLQSINISSLDLGEWNVEESLVGEIKDKIRQNPDYPPIVVSPDMSIIDGIHRANALAEMGRSKIKAYVGVEGEVQFQTREDSAPAEDVIFSPRAASESLPQTIKRAIGTAYSTFTNNPQNLPLSAKKLYDEYIREQKNLKWYDSAFSVPFRMAQKYTEWKEAWRIHGIARPEARANLNAKHVILADAYLKLEANLRKSGLSRKEAAASKDRVKRIIIASDIILHDRLVALKEEAQTATGNRQTDIQNEIDQIQTLRRFSDEELRKGIETRPGEITKLNDKEIAAYTSVRSAMDNMLETTIANSTAQVFRGYENKKWYATLLNAAGVDLSKESVQTLLGKAGLNSAAINAAKKIRVDLASVMDRIEKKIDAIPADELKAVGEEYTKISNKIKEELTKVERYLGQVTGITDPKELTRLTDELFTAYMRTRPQLKQIKEFRNQMNDWVGFFPRYREQGKHFLRLVQQTENEEGEMEERHIFSDMFTGIQEYADLREKIIKEHGDKDGNLPEGMVLRLDPVSVSPELAFQGVNDTNMQKILDDSISNMKVRSTYFNAAGEKIDIQEQLRQEAFQAIADQFKTRGAMKSSIHRNQKNGVIKGYEEEDLDRVLLNYISAMTGLMTKQSAAADFMDLMKDVKDPSMFNALVKYNREMLRNDSKSDMVSGKIRSFAFLFYIGGLLKSAVVNLTQNPIVGFAELSKYMREHGLKGIGDLAYSAAMKDVLAGKLNDVEKKVVEEMVSKGIAQDQYIQSIFEGLRDKQGKQIFKLARWLGVPFSMTEVYNRKSAAIALFRQAYPMYLKEGLSEKEAYDKAFADARTFVDNVHYAYGKANRPLWMQSGDFASSALKTAYTFRGFTHNFLLRQAELMSQKDFRTLLHTIAYLGLFGGLMGLPFFKDLFEWIEKKFGYSPTKAIRKTLRGAGGETLEKFGMSGLPSVLGANISGSLAVGLPWPIGSETPEDTVFGVYGGMLQKAKRSAQAMGRGDIGRAATEMAPEFMRNPIVAARESETGKALGFPGFASTPGGRPQYDEDGKPIQVKGSEAALKFFGFNPTERAREGEKNQTILRQEAWAADKKRAAGERYRIAKIKGDPDALKDLAANVVEINQGIRNRGLEKLIPLTSVSKIITSSRQVMGAKQRRELGYKRDEL
jgi:hypothetical protein